MSDRITRPTQKAVKTARKLNKKSRRIIWTVIGFATLIVAMIVLTVSNTVKLNGLEEISQGEEIFVVISATPWPTETRTPFQPATRTNTPASSPTPTASLTTTPLPTNTSQIAAQPALYPFSLCSEERTVNLRVYGEEKSSVRLRANKEYLRVFVKDLGVRCLQGSFLGRVEINGYESEGWEFLLPINKSGSINRWTTHPIALWNDSTVTIRFQDGTGMVFASSGTTKDPKSSSYADYDYLLILGPFRF